MDTPSYEETIDYLYLHLPMFQRVGAAAYKQNLDNTWALCEHLGNPQKKFRSVHVGGTNGKGSSSHMISAILQSAGYKTGLYTSPHLKDFTERIKINGEVVSREFVVDFVRRIRPVLEKIQPSFFEATVAMAFDYFALEQVDIAVIEVGLGGRLDSTNVITPMVSLITNIGNDHKDLLGGTRELIATEKAGIIKPGVPVVISERQEEVQDIFIRKAEKENSPIYFSTDRYQLRQKKVREDSFYTVYAGSKSVIEDLDCQLKGEYQRKNIPGVLMTIDQLVSQGFTISQASVREGIGKVVTMTGLKGRWQRLGSRPLMICDTGHNEDGIREIVKQIKSIKYDHLHIVFGIVKDKDIRTLLGLFPKDASYYFCQSKIPRALPARDLLTMAGEMGLKGVAIEDVNEAVRQASANASPDDFIFVGGSTFVVAEIENL